ncbi:MAG: Smr/MutS family protein [OM182 bacterium]|nr:Smr/MutS family protein [OM182 bacterium]
MNSFQSGRDRAMCPNIDCGIDLALDALACPKCDEPLPVGLRDDFLEVDVAHSGETWTEALDKLEAAIGFARAQRFKGLRVIHGIGREADVDAWEGPGRIRRESLNYLRQAAVDIDAQLQPEKYNRGAHLLVF